MKINTRNTKTSNKLFNKKSIRIAAATCPRCGGTGRFNDGSTCYYCNGRGTV